MKVPRISIHADFDDEASLGEINSSSLGYGIHQAWIYAAMFGAGSLFGIETIPTGTSLSLVYLISIVANFITLFVCATVEEKVTKLFVNRYPIIFPMILMTAGSLLMLLCDTSSQFAIVISIVSGLATGIGSAFYLLYWGISFSHLNLISVVMNTVLSFAFAILFYGIAAAMPAPYAGLTISILPIVEGIVIKRHAPRLYQEKRKLPFFNSLPVSKSRFSITFAIPMLFFGVALGYIRSVGMVDVFLAFGQSSNAMPVALAGLLAILVLVIAIIIMRNDLVEDFLRPVLPLIASAMVFVPLCSQTSAAYPGTFVLAGYICFEAVLWIIFAAFSQRYRLSPILVFGIGRSALGFGAAAGLAITSSIGHLYKILPFENITFVIIALICIVAGQATLPRERDLRRIVVNDSIDPDSLADALNLKTDDPKPDSQNVARQINPFKIVVTSTDNAATADAAKSASGNDSGSEVKGVSENEAANKAEGASECTSENEAKSFSGDEKAECASKAIAEESAENAANYITGIEEKSDACEDACEDATFAESDVSSNYEDSDDSETAAKRSHEGKPTNTSQETELGSSAQPAQTTQPSPAPTDYMLHAKSTKKTSKSNQNDRLKISNNAAFLKTPDSAQTEEEPKVGFFRRKCEVISNQYLLSARETEVLFYLAKGYNSAYIQERLYISEGTAKTHIRHIYGKTNVHSQQQLMRLVNEVRI